MKSTSKRKPLKSTKRKKNLQTLQQLDEKENTTFFKSLTFSPATSLNLSNASEELFHEEPLKYNDCLQTSAADLFKQLTQSEKKVNVTKIEVLSDSVCQNLNSQFFTPCQTVKKYGSSRKRAAIEKEDDSIFGNVDLSYIEKQCRSELKKTSILECEEQALTVTSTPKSNTRSTPKAIKASPVLLPLLTTPQQNEANKNNQTVLASGGPIAQRLLKRLQANAAVHTPRHLRMQPLCLKSPTASQKCKKIEVDPKPEEKLEMPPIATQDIGPFYGLPSLVKKLLAEVKGIKSVYKWQHDCLTLDCVQKRQNLIYSLPTSGGKTLVAEILIMKALLCLKKDAILILPFVAIVQEKVRGFAQFADKLDFLVEEYAGSKGRIPPTTRRKRNSIFVCTIEKANTLVNSLIESGRLNSIALVVVDELHMIGEGGRRGATIEMTLSKVLFISESTQVVGMSATLKNISEIAKFLRAEVYTNNFRPVKLHEHVTIEDSVYKIDDDKKYEENLLFHRVLHHKTKTLSSRDPDHILTLLLEVIPDHSCLIFCATKKNCENLAVMICKLLPKSFAEKKKSERKDLLKNLYKESGEAAVCSVLQQTIPYGIAYHHSGLTSGERYLIEDSYSSGVLCVITCTSTLAAGVNLPARRVIIRSPYIGSNFLSRVQYKQMIGRAGRKGIDTVGESFLIMTNERDKNRVKDLVVGTLETCISSLMYDEGKGFKTLLLNLIGLKIMKKLEDVESFFNITLFAHQISIHDEIFFKKSNFESSSIKTLAEKYLQELLDLNLVRVRRHTENKLTELFVEATLLGEATFRGSIDLNIANDVYQDLKKGLESLVLVNYLHLLYLVTPFDSVTNIYPNWMTYFEMYGRLNEGERKAANIVGITEQYLAAKATGHHMRKRKVNEFVVKRFYVTLMLYMLFRGLNVWQVASAFGQTRGFLQNLLASASSFACSLLHFIQQLEDFWPYHALLEKITRSLQFCTTAEIIPLMEIPGVKIGRAKQLYNAGFKSFTHIANTDAKTLMSKIEHLPKRQALQIISSAKVMLKEKIEELQAQAEELQTVPTIGI